MRKRISLDEGWYFTKGAAPIPTLLPADWDRISLPHTWNNTDGQDGGNDYYRGVSVYARELSGYVPKNGGGVYLEFEAANSVADVYIDGKALFHHEGGYSTFRVDITDSLGESSVLAVAVDNSDSERIYPRVADFTFYGGLYRSVTLIEVPKAHFDLDYLGAPGIQVTPTVNGMSGEVSVNAYVTNKEKGDSIVYTVTDGEGRIVAEKESSSEEETLTVDGVHLWHGVDDPYLYTATATLKRGTEELDRVSARIGFRSFEISPECGFILNGQEYPLRGVSRHQDRLGIGNALLPEHHREDMELIAEMGANTVRLAHYQHSQCFYDLCDEYGMVVWAEIPYISNHSPLGRENTVTQMKELIVQCYNHPSIVIWGLSNEITMKGDKDPDLLENHRILNTLCHSMDKTRLTAVAAVSPCPIDSPYLEIPDAVSYNHYFGWYGGETDMNGPWFDKFHEAHPDIPIGCSEYGCEALDYHTSSPVQGDYTEEYQAYYHEELIRQLFSRKYLFATHVWNMFDFGADARSEGGEPGQNHKGLVTMDRKYKKDAFYAYKAWLSDKPFVHIAGKRYAERAEDRTRVTVYSNLPEVELVVNGNTFDKKSAPDHFFYFDVPLSHETKIEAIAGDERDVATFRRVSVPNEKYRLKEVGTVINWFEITEKPGRLSINDKISEILKTKRGKLTLLRFALKIKRRMKENEESGTSPTFEFTEGSAMMDMIGGFTPLRLAGMIGMLGVTLTKKELLTLNKRLNRIRKRKA